MQETVADPEPPAILPGERAPHVNPDGTVSLSVTAPVKWLRLVTVTVAGPIVPAFAMTLVTVAVIAKSTTWTPTVMLCARPPLLLFTFAV
jgi:hypothetical protein